MSKKKASKRKRGRQLRSSELVIRRFVRKLRAEEKRYGEMAKKFDASSPSNEWFKGWCQGTGNAMGWLADNLNGCSVYVTRNQATRQRASAENLKL